MLERGLRPALLKYAAAFWTLISRSAVMVLLGAWSVAVSQPSSTTLAITPGTSVSAGTVITLNAMVTSSGAPVRSGLVNFCDRQMSTSCEDGALLGSVWMTRNGTATLRLPLGYGNHRIEAVFTGTGSYSASASGAQTVSALTGNSPTSTVITYSQYLGYNGLNEAQTTVTGSPLPTLSGTLSFVDVSNANTSLASLTLPAPSYGFTKLSSVGGPAIAQPQWTAVGDFNSDGFLDFAVVSNAANAVQIYLGNGNGGFTLASTLSVYAPAGLLVADINGDGQPDIAVLGYSTVPVFLGNGNGTFTLASSPNAGDSPYAFAAGDFNRDGYLDLAITNNYSNTVQVLLGNGDGTFKQGNSFGTGNNPLGIVAADFNGDGMVDLAAVNQMDNTVTVLFGLGDGTFSSGPLLAVPQSPYTLAVGDFNGDGVPDLAISALVQAAEIYLGAGDGSFRLASSVSCGASANGYGIETADFNHDGNTDLVVGGTIFAGDGSGHFNLLGYVGGNGSPVSVGDFNGDGSPDLITPVYSNWYPYNGNVYIALEQSSVATTVDPIRVLGPGAHQVLASYSGDSFHVASGSGTVTMTGAPISITLGTSVYPGTSVGLGTTVQFVAALAPATVGSYQPTGTISFYDGSALFGTAAIASGQAIFSSNSLAAGTHTITAKYAGDVNFSGASAPPVSVTITGQQTPSISWPAPAPIGYGTALSSTQLNATAGGVPGTFAYTPGIGTVLPAGTQTLSVTFTPADTSTYGKATAVVSLTVLKAPLSVTANNASTTYGSTLPGFTATYIGFVNGDSVTVLTGSPSLTTTATSSSPVGTYPITASQGTLGAANYSFTFTNGVLTIAKATLTVTASNVTRIYGGKDPALAATYSGFLNGDTVTVLSGVPSLTTTVSATSPVGAYTILASAGTLSASNYTFAFANGTFTIAPAPLTITAQDQSKIYGQTLTLPTTAFTASGLQNGETIGGVTLASAGSAPTASVSGSPYSIVPSAAAGGSFTPTNYAITYVNGYLTVTKATPTVTRWPTASTLTYGQALSASALTNGAASVPGTFAFANPLTVPGAGTAAQSVLFTPTDAADYNNVSGTVNVTVNKAVLTVTAANASRTYGASNPVFTPIYAGFVNGDTSAVLGGSPSLTTTATVTSVPGTYRITASAGTLSATNYSFTFVNGTLTITQAPLTITANNQSKIYGQTLTLGTRAFTATGLQNGETIGGVTLSSSGAAASASAAGSPYSIVPSNATGGTFTPTNYSITYVNGYLTVTNGPTTTAVSTPNKTNIGVPFNASATVSAQLYPGTPTGTVVFTSNDPAHATCTAALNKNAKASCAMTINYAGTWTITGVYSGDANYAMSSGTSTVSE